MKIVPSALWLILISLLGSASESRASLLFNRDVRPLLAEACFHCHGPDPGTRKADLRLDTEAGLFSGESPTVVKGEPMKSELYLRLISEDEDEIMPPPEAHKTLNPEQIALVKSWIEQGAPWQAHWSLIPPVRPAVPEPKDKAWGKNAIDQFVLVELEKLGLQPAPQAEARALMSRDCLLHPKCLRVTGTI